MDAVITGAIPPDSKLDESFEFQQITPPEGMTWEEVGALSEQILFCVPHRAAEGVGGGIADQFGDFGRWGLQTMRMKDPSGGFLEVLRAGIVRVFLQYTQIRPKIRYLVMCDNDQEIDRFDPIRLARWDKPIVSGVVCGFTDEKGLFACFTTKGKDGLAYFPTAHRLEQRDGVQVKVPNPMPATGLVQAHQVGTGFLCIRRDVLETFDRVGEIPFYIPEKIRRQAATTGDLRKSEDICFSDLCETYGFERFVDLSVQIVHYKNIGFGWKSGGVVDPNLAVEDWDVSTGFRTNGED